MRREALERDAWITSRHHFSAEEKKLVGRRMPAVLLAVSFVLSSVPGERAGPELLCRLGWEREHREVKVPLVSIGNPEFL